MKTLIYSIHGFDKSFLKKSAVGKHELVYTEKRLNASTAHLAKGYEAIAVFSSDIASAEVLEQLKEYGVNYIATRSVGYDHIDLEKAKELGIKVANVPSYSPYAIAEHAVTLLMTINRKIRLSQSLMQQNDFRLDQLIGFDIHGKTIGIVGTGKIGEAFARIMHGFGCQLLAYDIEENKDLIRTTGIQYVSLEEVCKAADVISVSCPLNKATRYLFNKTVFAHMKKGVVFINTARGGIVNTTDLLDALDQGIVSSAGLDVYEQEKPIFFNDLTQQTIEDELFERLRNHPQVLLTGHQAFLTNEALQGISDTTVCNLTEWERDGRSENDLGI